MDKNHFWFSIFIYFFIYFFIFFLNCIWADSLNTASQPPRQKYQLNLRSSAATSCYNDLNQRVL